VLSKDYKLDTGLKVKEGDVLVQLDTGDVDIEIQQAKNELRVGEARIAVGSANKYELESAQSDFNNTERLYKMGQVSESDYEKARRAVETIQQAAGDGGGAQPGEPGTDETTLATKEREKEKMTIRAPSTGEVSAGDWRTRATSSTRVPHRLPHHDDPRRRGEDQRGGLREHQGGPEGHRHLPSLRGMGVQRDREEDPADRRPRDPAPPGGPRHHGHRAREADPGITGEVSIVVGRHAKAIIPRRALLNENVFVVKDGKVELRPVKPGYEWLTGAEIVRASSPASRSSSRTWRPSGTATA
jgi:hypothetical protein